jgi:hypothetical protein
VENHVVSVRVAKAQPRFEPDIFRIQVPNIMVDNPYSGCPEFILRIAILTGYFGASHSSPTIVGY